MELPTLQSAAPSTSGSHVHHHMLMPQQPSTMVQQQASFLNSNFSSSATGFATKQVSGAPGFLPAMAFTSNTAATPGMAVDIEQQLHLQLQLAMLQLEQRQQKQKLCSPSSSLSSFPGATDALELSASSSLCEGFSSGAADGCMQWAVDCAALQGGCELQGQQNPGDLLGQLQLDSSLVGALGLEALLA
jgi:hypothetical protein